MPNDILTPTPKRLRNTRQHLAEDIQMARLGVLDRLGFLRGWQQVVNPVQATTTSLLADDADVHPALIARDQALFTDPMWDGRHWRDRAWGNRRRRVREIRRNHNLRTTQGRDNWQRGVMSGDITANSTSYTGVAGAATGATATTLTNSGAAFPTSGGINGSLQGHIVVATTTNSRYGVILSNTGTALTIDQWYDPTSATGASGSTPSTTTAYQILPGMGPALWIGLTTNSAAAAAGDVLRTADGLFGDGTTGAAATETTTNGLARAYQQATYATGNYALAHTWTYTGSGAVVLAKVVLCNSLAAAGSLMFLETLLSATGTVTANGDTIAVTWTVTL